MATKKTDDEQPQQQPATDDGLTTELGLVDEPRRIEGEQENPAPAHETANVETYPEYLERTGGVGAEPAEPVQVESYPEHLQRKGADKQ